MNSPLSLAPEPVCQLLCHAMFSWSRAPQLICLAHLEQDPLLVSPGGISISTLQVVITQQRGAAMVWIRFVPSKIHVKFFFSSITVLKTNKNLKWLFESWQLHSHGRARSILAGLGQLPQEWVIIEVIFCFFCLFLLPFLPCDYF